VNTCYLPAMNAAHVCVLQTLQGTRVFRVGKLVSQQRVAATDNAKNRWISLPKTGLDLRFKIPHGRKWYDLGRL